MKNLKAIVPAILLLSFVFLNSCSVEKRKHRPGYHVDWFAGKKSVAPGTTQDFSAGSSKDERYQPSELNMPGEVYASGENKFSEAMTPNQKLNTLLGAKSTGSCDLIIFKNGDEIEAKVSEVSKQEVKYKLCDNPDGPMFVKRSSEIFMIKYVNGTKEMIESEEPAKSVASGSGYNVGQNLNSPPPAKIPSGKSKLVAVLLWLFLGIIGIHRFYLGHIGMGILYLLTFGLCGIGWLVDGILFLTGDLKPKDGDYDED